MTNILITGGAGYIGSHTCKLISAAGYNPVVYDNLSTGHVEFVKWGDLVIGDISDTSRLIEAFNKYKPVAVIHFAASAYVGESVVDPLKYYSNNFAGTISLLKAMKECGIMCLVFSSTCAIYGVHDGVSISEQTEKSPINPYGHSKLMVEQMLGDLSSQQKLRYVSLRYFNAAGADPQNEIGEWHVPETHLIPLAINSALTGEQLTVFGGDFPTADGTPVRDYIHVNDLANAHILAFEYLLDGGGSSCFNLGTGIGTSVKEILDSLLMLGHAPNYKMAGRREGDPPYLVADATHAINVLGWAPMYKNIDSILSTALEWHISRFV